jgi:beta-lactamase regulating signal transducer with metallopeptidase domain/cell division septation protein DedD
METISRYLLTFLLNSIWQIALVAAVAMAACRLMRNGPASHRYAVWVAALFAAVLLPMASVRTGERSTTPQVEVSFAPQASTSPSKVVPITPLRAAPQSSSRTVSLAETTATLTFAVYFLFLLFRFWKLAGAWMRTMQIRRGAREIPNVPPPVQSVLTRCLQVFSLKGVTLLSSASIPSPVTAGVFRKIIILPDCLLTETSTDVLATAIGHEMAHIARHDFVLSLAYELLYLPVSFHPAAWAVRRGIAQTREMACDEMVTRQLLDAGVYARSIVSIATTMTGLARPGYTLGVFDGDILEERIRRLMERPVANLKRARLVLATGLSAIAVCGVIASGLALTARAQSGSQAEMKLAQTAYNARDFQGAVEHFDNAAKLDPANVKPKLFLANALLREFFAAKGQHDNSLLARAREQYTDVLARDSHNQVAAQGLLAVAIDSGQQSEARDWGLKLIRLDPADKSAYYAVGVMDWSIVYPEFQRVKQAAGAKPEDYSIPDANLRRELREKSLPQVDEGLSMLQIALQIDPGYDAAMAYTNLLYRLKAGLVDSPLESAELIAKADTWVGKALATKREHARVEQRPGPKPLDVDGPPPGPADVHGSIAVVPGPPPPPLELSNQIASALPISRPRNAEQPDPYWQVAGSDVPAVTLLRNLESKGFHAVLYPSREDNLVRVMVGPYSDAQTLERAKGEIEAAGFRALRVW